MDNYSYAYSLSICDILDSFPIRIHSFVYHQTIPIPPITPLRPAILYIMTWIYEHIDYGYGGRWLLESSYIFIVLLASRSSVTSTNEVTLVSVTRHYQRYCIFVYSILHFSYSFISRQSHLLYLYQVYRSLWITQIYQLCIYNWSPLLEKSLHFLIISECSERQ